MAIKKQVYVKTPSVTTFDELNRELYRIETAFNTLSVHVPTEITTVAPDKDVELQIKYADGVTWNPGKGEGLYINIKGSWKKLSYE